MYSIPGQDWYEKFKKVPIPGPGLFHKNGKKCTQCQDQAGMKTLKSASNIPRPCPYNIPGPCRYVPKSIPDQQSRIVIKKNKISLLHKNLICLGCNQVPRKINN
jgi:hypothetical protein